MSINNVPPSDDQQNSSAVPQDGTQQPTQQQPPVDNSAPQTNAPNPPQQTNQQQPAPKAQQPAQQQGSWVRSLFDHLAGPSNTYKWNADKGKMEQVPVQRTKREISSAILATALMGAFAGSKEKGPGAPLRAFGVAGSQQVDRNQQQDSQAQAQVGADLARRQAIFENNMRAMNNGVAYSRSSLDEHKARAEAWKSQVDDIAENAPDSVIGIDQPLSEEEASDIKKYPPDQYDRKPYGVAPRIGPDGKPVFVDYEGKVVPEGTPGAYNPTDSTYVLVKKDAKTNLSDENGVKPWLKDAVTKWGGIVPGANSSLLAGDGAKGQISAYTAGKMQHQVDALNHLQGELTNFAKTLNEGKNENSKDLVQPANLKQAINDGKLTLRDVEYFQKAMSQSTQIDLQLDALRSAHPDSAARLTAVLNGENGHQLEDFKQAREARKTTEAARSKAAQVLDENDAGFVLAHPDQFSSDTLDAAKRFQANAADFAGAKTAAQEKAKQEIEAANQRSLDVYTNGPDVEVPENFGSMNPTDMRKYLESKGVKIPDEFNSLYSVGILNSQELNKAFPTRLSAKTGQMDDQHALSFIQKYINPNFHDSDYAAAKEFNTQLANPKTSPVIAAGVAAQHLDMLRDAGEALKNNDIQALNSLARSFGTATGDDKYVVFKAIADQVNNEVGKVVAGGPPHETELGQLRENLNAKESWKQIDGVIRGYSKLMGGRLSELQDSSQQYFRRDLHVNPRVTALFQKYGIDTPWHRQTAQQQQQQQQAPPSNLLKNDGSITKFKNGQYWMMQNDKPVQVDQTGKPLS